jgi:hypothetical protein
MRRAAAEHERQSHPAGRGTPCEAHIRPAAPSGARTGQRRPDLRSRRPVVWDLPDLASTARIDLLTHPEPAAA